jgi:uroporphyrinogen decarboxylase
MNDLLLKALRCEPVPRPPVWLMRQAGRYMPSYQALRARYSLWELFHRPELAAEVTQMPLIQLGVDAAILFSDILVIAEALGLAVAFPAQGGPRIEPAIRSPDQVVSLSYIPVEESLRYVFETIALLKKTIQVPLIGFCGGPFTVATYCLDSTDHASFAQTKKWVHQHPEAFHKLLSKITQATVAYLQGQVQAGADVLQIFDSWANILTDKEFIEYSLPYLQRIIDALKPSGVPIIVFCRDSSLRVAPLASLQPAGISFDWHLSMLELRKKTPASIAIQGNFNPAFLKSPQKVIVKDLRELLSSMKESRGFIVNLGHGVTPDVPFDHVRCFVEEVISYAH